MKKPDGSQSTFVHVGWWIPGTLQSGWSNTYQANFNDMAPKLQQLKLKPLVPGLFPNQNLGFYFSEAEWDFIQLLAVESPVQTDVTIVAYSVWLADQGWASMSPIPILDLKIPGFKCPTASSSLLADTNTPWDYTDFPVGWYLPGTLNSTWYENLNANYKAACKKRKELGLLDLSSFYFTQSASYDCIQMVQPPAAGGKKRKGEAIHFPDETLLRAYVEWFSEMGFGNLGPVPFMSPNLVSEALLLAGKTP